MFCNITAFGHFRTTSGGRKCQKAHLHTKTFHLDLFTCFYDHLLQRYSLEKLIFGKTAVLGNFGHIWPTSGNPMWPKLPKAHPHANTFHLRLLPCLYEHLLQRNSLEKFKFRKTAVFDILTKLCYFRWSNLAKTVIKHIYILRHFI